MRNMPFVGRWRYHIRVDESLRYTNVLSKSIEVNDRPRNRPYRYISFVPFEYWSDCALQRTMLLCFEAIPQLPGFYRLSPKFTVTIISEVSSSPWSRPWLRYHQSMVSTWIRARQQAKMLNKISRMSKPSQQRFYGSFLHLLPRFRRESCSGWILTFTEPLSECFVRSVPT